MSKIKEPNFIKQFLTEDEEQSMIKAIKTERQQAKEYLKKGSYDMAAMHYGDGAALCRVMGKIKEGKFKDAADTARNQDTAARENIPQAVWDKLSQFG